MNIMQQCYLITVGENCSPTVMYIHCKVLLIFTLLMCVVPSPGAKDFCVLYRYDVHVRALALSLGRSNGQRVKELVAIAPAHSNDMPCNDTPAKTSVH